MTIKIRGDSSATLASIEKGLEPYAQQHPNARIELYQHNSISVRIRVIDPKFTGLERSARHAMLWQHLENLPEEVQGDISMVVLLAPGEERKSLANLEFEDPSPSLIQ